MSYTEVQVTLSMPIEVQTEGDELTNAELVEAVELFNSAVAGSPKLYVYTVEAGGERGTVMVDMGDGIIIPTNPGKYQDKS